MRMLRMALVAAALAAVGVAGTAGAASLITGGDIKNGSIGVKDLSKAAKRALKGNAGPPGPTGATGLAGPQGPAGPASLSTTVRTKDFISSTNVAQGQVRCPAGMVAVGGTVSPGNLFTVTDLPSPDGRGWVGEAVGPDSEAMRIAVICTPGTVQVLPNGT